MHTRLLCDIFAILQNVCTKTLFGLVIDKVKKRLAADTVLGKGLQNISEWIEIYFNIQTYLIDAYEKLSILIDKKVPKL